MSLSVFYPSKFSLSDFMNAPLNRTKPMKGEPNLCSTIFAAAA
ncbi:MAG: hypothetical protein WCS31_12265 [Verrucomicrobiae bacterium]